MLEKDTTLLDRILFGAALERWGAGRSQLQGATAFRWDFGMGQGKTSSEVPLSDPTTNVTYAGRLPVWTFLEADSTLHTGLGERRVSHRISPSATFAIRSRRPPSKLAQTA